MKLSVVGSINMDMTVVAERIPRKGETIQGKELRYAPGGKGANQAVAMARLGADVTMFGCVGDDRNADLLLRNLRSQGVQTEYIRRVKDAATGGAFITVGNRDNTIIIVSGANAKADCAYIDSISEELLKSDMVVLQHEIPIETVEYVIDICYQHSIPVLLNPAPAHAVSTEILEKITYLTPNEHEAEIIFGKENLEEILRDYPEKLIVTLGEAGVVTCLKSGEIRNIPSRPANVVDTTGAGDTLNGAFAVRVSEQAGVEAALRFANVAASLSIEKFGAQSGMPDREMVLEQL